MACTPDNSGIPPDVVLDESSSLLGSDANSDGVRDDIEQAISKMPESDEVKSLFRAFSSAGQDLLRLDTSERTPAIVAEALSTAEGQWSYMYCSPDGTTYDEWYEKLQVLDAMQLNTAERQAKSQAVNQLLAGSVIRSLPCPTSR